MCEMHTWNITKKPPEIQAVCIARGIDFCTLEIFISYQRQKVRPNKHIRLQGVLRRYLFLPVKQQCHRLLPILVTL